MTPKQVIESWMQRVWADRDVSAIDELLADPCMVKGLSTEPITSPEEFKVFHSKMLEAFTSINITMEDLVESGQFICGIGHVEVVHRATGKSGSFTIGVYGRFVDDKWVEANNTADFLTLLIQLGEVPETALESVLTYAH